MSNSALTKYEGAIAKGSVYDVAASSGKDLALTIAQMVKVVALVDTSGSMDAYMENMEDKRHDAAERELRKLQNDNPGQVLVYSFSKECIVCPLGIPLRQDAGTDMALALRTVRGFDAEGMKIVIISDGIPDDQEETLAEAAKFRNAELHCIYIGDSLGADFLKRLADAKGGSYAKTTANLLAAPIEKLLEAK